MRNVRVVAGAVSLVTTAAVLFAASLLAGTVPIKDFNAWFAATQVVWVFGVIAMLLLPLAILRKRLAVGRVSRSVAHG